MRAKHFIVEYDRSKTAQAYAAKLVNTAMADTTVPGAVRNKIQDNMTPEKAAEMILQNIEVGDPTKQKKYSQALARMYANGLIKWEDVTSTMRDQLTKFATLAVKKQLKPEHSDFNSFKSIAHFYDAVSQYDEPEGKERRDKGTAKEIYKDANVRIIQPQDTNAACYYGQGTRWCTASDNNNMFDRYNQDGPMYILMPTTPEYDGEKYQIHPDSGQYMDEKDSEVEPLDLMKRFGEDFQTWLLTVDPDLSRRVAYYPDYDKLYTAIQQIKTIGEQFLDEVIFDWEASDETYFEFLQAEGYIDEEGEYAEEYPSYADYNDQVGAYQGQVLGALDSSVEDVQEMAQQMDEETPQYITELQDVVSEIVDRDTSDWANDEVSLRIYREIQCRLNDDGDIKVEQVEKKEPYSSGLSQN